MDTTTKYTNGYRSRVKTFSDASPTFREDVLKTSSDLFQLGEGPELVRPNDGTHFVGVTGNRDSHAHTFNLLTCNPEYGFEDCQVDRVRVNGLWMKKGAPYEEARAKIQENPENMAKYFTPESATLLEKAGEGKRYRWSDGGISANMIFSPAISCSYYITAENGDVVLPKTKGYEVLKVGYNPIQQRADLFGWNTLRENNPERIRAEGVLAEIWDDVAKMRSGAPIKRDELEATLHRILD